MDDDIRNSKYHRRFLRKALRFIGNLAHFSWNLSAAQAWSVIIHGFLGFADAG